MTPAAQPPSLRRAGFVALRVTPLTERLPLFTVLNELYILLEIYLKTI